MPKLAPPSLFAAFSRAVATHPLHQKTLQNTPRLAAASFNKERVSEIYQAINPRVAPPYAARVKGRWNETISDLPADLHRFRRWDSIPIFYSEARWVVRRPRRG